MPNAIRHLWPRAVMAFAFWTLIGLAFGVQFHFATSEIGNAVPWSRALLHSLTDWYTFALLSIPAVWLARRLPIERPHRGKALLLHFCASVLFSILYSAVRSGIGLWQAGGQADFGHAFRAVLVKSWHFNLLVYWVIAAVCHAFDYYKRYTEREVRTIELERRLAEARLQALQMQLNPHFLFNTLHAISSLMHKDVDAADAMLVRLSELLRHALDATNTQEVPLREELHFLSRYLDIERTRFGERLAVELNIEPVTLDAFVPNLMLQPLLENAIKHGLEPHSRPGRIEVIARRIDNQLQIRVVDNGGGVRPGNTREGVGLSNTRARLQQLYGAAHRFVIGSAPVGGTEVCLELPFRLANASTLREQKPIERQMAGPPSTA